MIIIDPKIQTITTTSKLAKASKKELSNRIKFKTNNKAKEISSSEESRDIANIAPMFFLQEIDQYSEDLENLKEFSKKSLKCLKELQFALLGSEINHRQLHNLKDVIENNSARFTTPELSSLAEEIKLRIAVEIAKIESSHN